MPRNDGPSGYRPQYVPALQMNSDGLMVNNSAQTQVSYGLQKLLLEKGNNPRRANESIHMRYRQSVVDEYLQAAGKPDRITTDKWSCKLPTIASPQPVLSGLYDGKNLQAQRKDQLKGFGDSFLGSGIGIAKMVYGEIDDALRAVDERKAGLSLKQKASWSSEKKKQYFFEPLRESVKFLDDYFAKDNKPVRIKWREIQISSDHTRVDLYFVYPNTKGQYEAGFNTWAGAGDVTTP